MVNANTAAHIAKHSNADLVFVATAAALDATPVSQNVFAHCMRELALRLDKPTFTVLCANIAQAVQAAA